MTFLDHALGQLARDIPGATQIFHEYQLDFCCAGKHTLREAAGKAGVDGALIAERLQRLQNAAATDARDWRAASPAELIGHLVTRFHEVHRQQLPELVRLARKVEQVHAGNDACPAGLADHLSAMQQELESHMQKEEQVLFPMLAAGQGALAGGPITVLRMEHEQHGDALQGVSELTQGITLPPGACATWRALYVGLATLREDLMEHIHLENNILFERAVPLLDTPLPQAANA